LDRVVRCVTGSARITAARNQRCPHPNALIRSVRLLTSRTISRAPQEERWSSDPDEFIADEEDDAISVRVSCEMLVDQIVTVYDSAETLSVVWRTALRRLEEGNAARLASDANWWKAREAAFVMLGTINEHLLEHLQV
jgi:hypothetical protein